MYVVTYYMLMVPQNNKSPGSDQWPITVIKSASEFISVPLSILFNEPLNSGILPPDWKYANVTPIHKNGAGNLACNHQLVNVISIFSKLMEFIVKDHITKPLIHKQPTVPLSIWIYTREIMLHRVTFDTRLFGSSLRY